MTPIRIKNQRDYGLIDGSFHKNFEIHVNSFELYKRVVALMVSAKLFFEMICKSLMC